MYFTVCFRQCYLHMLRLKNIGVQYLCLIGYYFSLFFARDFTLRWPQFAGQVNMFNAAAVDLMRS